MICMCCQLSNKDYLILWAKTVCKFYLQCALGEKYLRWFLHPKCQKHLNFFSIETYGFYANAPKKTYTTNKTDVYYISDTWGKDS